MRSPVLVAVGLVVVVVAGCAPVVERARSAPVAAPAFASEEEALAAATDAYARYIDVTDEIAHGGSPGQLADVAIGSFLERSIVESDAFANAGKRQVGATTFRDVTFQSSSGGSVVVYLCDDITQVDIVDSNGVSLVSPDRPDTNYFQVSFDPGADGILRVSGVERWDDRQC